MPTIKYASLVCLLLVSAAWSQTKEQCSALAAGMRPLTSAMGDADKAVATIMTLDWTLVINGTSGSFRSAAENARQTQSDFANALRKYKEALDDFAYQAQLCAQ
jgi:hypothetical protein